MKNLLRNLLAVLVLTILYPGAAGAAAPAEIKSITASCSGSTASGTVTMSAPYTGSISLVVASHKPGEGHWTQTGGTSSVSFSNSTAQSFSIPVALVSGANSYRVEVAGSNPPVGGASENTKSNSFQCGGSQPAGPPAGGPPGGPPSAPPGGGGGGAGGAGGGEKVKVCHATGSDSNPYVFIEVDSNATDFEGHKRHADEGNPPGGRPDLMDGYNATVNGPEDCPTGEAAGPPPTPTRPGQPTGAGAGPAGEEAGPSDAQPSPDNVAGAFLEAQPSAEEGAEAGAEAAAEGGEAAGEGAARILGAPEEESVVAGAFEQVAEEAGGEALAAPAEEKPEVRGVFEALLPVTGGPGLVLLAVLAAALLGLTGAGVWLLRFARKTG
ncbi:MAG: hypothetical protein HYY05_07120 [Chloroflexi bacterium]|nr:hypothetical protein [Chloroflexota bacterium]